MPSSRNIIRIICYPIRVLFYLIKISLFDRLFRIVWKRDSFHADTLISEKKIECEKDQLLDSGWSAPSLSKETNKSNLSELGSQKTNSLETPEICQFDHICRRLSEITHECAETDLREFMDGIVARIEEEISKASNDISIGFIEELVDRIDELKLIVAAKSKTETTSIIEFRHVMIELLKEAKVELIDAESWNPELQRAIAKEPKSDLQEPSILQVGSSGIRRSGILIRKQEVVLGVPHNP